jgi:putative iron-regulated protein
LWLCGVLSLTGCQRLAAADLHDDHALRALATYADIAFATYDDAASAARALVSASDALLSEPTQENLARAREAWLRARIPYAQSEVFRFYDGPIDALELWVNTWPIDESFVESQLAAGSGMIDDVARFPVLTRELLLEQNGKAGETSIASGYHVIEFLLWGRDVSRDGPGARPASDFDASGSDARAAQLARRRGQYLKLAAELLVEHLDTVVAAWRAQPGNYRAGFLARPQREALALVLKGMGALSGAELAGERLTVAYETKHQENEHSCFSDSTHLDLAGNVRGLQNICRGRYQRQDDSAVSGLGVCALIAERAPHLGAKLREQIDASLRAALAIPAPFDTAILGSDNAPSRKAVAGAIAALQGQTQTLSEIAAALSLSGAGR